MKKLAYFLLLQGLLPIPKTAAQPRPYTKIYLGNPFVNLLTTIDPTTPLAISYQPRRTGYALIETDLDSLGLILPNQKTFFLHFDTGKTYYYWNQDGGYRDVSENAFWLTVSETTSNASRYPHYILSRTGEIKKIDD